LTAHRLNRCRAALDRRQPDLRVLMDGVHKPHNLSAILRTCDAVGVFQAHAVVPRGNLAIHRHCAAGAGQWVETVLHDEVTAAVRSLQSEGVRVYAAHWSPRAVDFRDVDYTAPTAVLMGAELWGVSDAGAAAADGHISVPMAGLVESLNVSVAAAVILFEAQRQRQAAGFYDQVRLDPERYRRTLFEWLHPRLAARCRELGEAYPALDADGDPIRSASAADN
jgi:tRNA (guanosine-2'-O-)-methyltransferase